jgi:hypothetical protein
VLKSRQFLGNGKINSGKNNLTAASSLKIRRSVLGIGFDAINDPLASSDRNRRHDTQHNAASYDTTQQKWHLA